MSCELILCDLTVVAIPVPQVVTFFRWQPSERLVDGVKTPAHGNLRAQAHRTFRNLLAGPFLLLHA